MYKFSNILLPTDFSDNFEIALNYGKEMAKSIGSTLHLLHTVETIIVPSEVVFAPHAKIVDIENQIKEYAENKLKEISDELESEGFNVKSSITEGKPDEEIVKYAEENNIDLICIAAHGKSGIEHFLLGSTTEKVLRTAPCPVIAAKMAKQNM